MCLILAMVPRRALGGSYKVDFSTRGKNVVPQASAAPSPRAKLLPVPFVPPKGAGALALSDARSDRSIRTSTESTSHPLQPHQTSVAGCKVAVANGTLPQLSPPWRSGSPRTGPGCKPGKKEPRCHNGDAWGRDPWLWQRIPCRPRPAHHFRASQEAAGPRKEEARR